MLEMAKAQADMLYPRFLLNDKNGYALAMALAAGLNALRDAAMDGLRTVQDVDFMPEWRLDELAYEYNCLYDYDADIEQKRAWISEAMPIYLYTGTPYALKRFLTDAFADVHVLENWEYNGQPYHYRLDIDAPWSAKGESWAIKCAEKAQNLRSHLDRVRFEQETGTRVYVGYALSLQGKSIYTATYDMPSADMVLTDEDDDMLGDEHMRLLEV